MIRYFLVALAALLAHPISAAPTISGCGTTAVPKADVKNPTKLQAQADCFGAGEALAKKAKDARLDLLKAIVTAPTADPITAARRAALIVPGYGIPASASPDNLGAFRFICDPAMPGGKPILNYDDAIVYPGKLGGSPHGHQNVGNTGISGISTNESLAQSGLSTCSNELNRGAYWFPWLTTGDGKNVISADFVAIYYKRLPASDPSCLTVSIKGCVPLPDGLRVLSGFDMKRMGEAQPENATFSFRCADDGKPQIHRKLIGEAIKDCGGRGSIWAQVDFGNCWDGRLDSPDHRSQLAFGGYGDWGYYRCPNTHPYMIPQLAQIVAFTIEKSDGEVYFSSDRMAGMNMPGGSTFHADYIARWDSQAQGLWEKNCLNKKLSCSDGELGDGTMLKRPNRTYKAEPRLVPVPARPTS